MSISNETDDDLFGFSDKIDANEHVLSSEAIKTIFNSVMNQNGLESLTDKELEEIMSESLDNGEIEDEILQEDVNKFKIVNFINDSELKNPEYNYKTDSGFDLRSIEEYLLAPGEYKVFKTPYKFEIPYGYELQVRPRSGLAAKFGVTVLNTPGTVDQDYRDYIGVILINHGKECFQVKIGDRIAQGVFSAILQGKDIRFTNKEVLSDTQRGLNGFGSTGV